MRETLPLTSVSHSYLGLGSFVGGKGKEGINSNLERAGTPFHLGEKKSSLERREQSNGEVVRVDVRREFPVGMMGSESIADGGCPLIEPCGDESSGLGVDLGELTNK